MTLITTYKLINNELNHWVAWSLFSNAVCIQLIAIFACLLCMAVGQLMQ